MLVKNGLRKLSLIVTIVMLSACANGPGLPKPTKLVDITVAQEITEHWQVQVGEGVKQHSLPLQPLRIGSQLYTAAHSGEVSALDGTTGELIWQVDLQQTISAGLGVIDNHLLVATANGELHKLSMADGSSIWTVPTSSEVLAVPQAAADLVLAQSIDGRLTAYSAKDGSMRWTYTSDVPSLTLRGTSTPVIDSGMTYVGFANGKLLALDNQQGNIIWQQRISAPKGRSDIERLVDIDGPLQLVEGTLYVVGYQGNLTAVEALTGKVLWQQPVSSVTAPSIYGDQIFVVTDKGTLIAYERQSGTELWRNDAFLHRGLSQTVVIDDSLLVADQLGYVHLLQALDGQVIGRHKLGHSGSGVGFVRYGADIYILGQDASLSRLSLN